MRNNREPKTNYSFSKLARKLEALDRKVTELITGTCNEKGSEQKIPFLINSTEVAALFTLLKDCGFIAPVSDYKLGKLMEQTCLYESERPMKGANKVISKHRCMEVNTEETLGALKQRLLNAQIIRTGLNEK